jgi:hypothetical protein
MRRFGDRLVCHALPGSVVLAYIAADMRRNVRMVEEP